MSDEHTIIIPHATTVEVVHTNYQKYAVIGCDGGLYASFYSLPDALYYTEHRMGWRAGAHVIEWATGIRHDVSAE